MLAFDLTLLILPTISYLPLGLGVSTPEVCKELQRLLVLALIFKDEPSVKQFVQRLKAASPL